MHDIRWPNTGQRSTGLWLIVALLVVMAAIVFIARGPRRAAGHPSDFVLVYGPARTWLVGGNPYDHAQIDRVWLEAHGPSDFAPSRRPESGLLYPPTTLLMFAPFAALTWPAAHHVWIAANVMFLTIVVWSIARLAGFTLRQRRTWLFVAGALAFAPVHTTFHHGQTPLYVMSVGMLGFVLASSGASGALLSLASAIKPQIGLPMLALQGVRRRWRSMLVGVAAIALLSLGAILPMMVRGVPWWSSWRGNLAALRHGGAGDPSLGNPDRHQMLHLHYPITALTDNARFAEIAAFLIVAALAAIFFLPPKKQMQRTSLLHALSMVMALTLMVVYHRFYDAVLLLAPLAWAIDGVARDRRRSTHWCALALLLPFFLNSATALVWFDRQDRVPGWLVESWWWEHLLLPHQGWALLGLALCLMIAQRRSHSTVIIDPALASPTTNASAA